MNLGRTITLLEKSHYPFRNYPKTSCETLLFPGCSFPSQFPKTMDALADLCRSHDVGIAYDCCGKPIAELGEKGGAARITQKLSARLTQLGVREVVCLCPNCMDYLRKTLDLPVISVYTLLSRWQYRSHSSSIEGVLFRPCPDRCSGAISEEISALLPLYELRPLEGVACCGLRGDIAAHGPAAGETLCARVRERAAGATINTYCASCSGQFQRHGCGSVRHLLSYILGVDEAPDSAHALMNRARTKFKR